MPTQRHVARVWDRTSNRVGIVRDRLSLSSRAFVALLATLSGIAVLLLALAAITDDVGEGDGAVLRDPHRLQFFVDHRSDLLIQAARSFTNVGSVTLLIPFAVLFGVFLWYRRVPLALAIAPAISLALCGALVAVAKHVFARTRPPVPLHLVVEGDASFPSGHSADSAALYLTFALVLAVVLLRRPLARVLALAVAAVVVVLVGASRLVLGVHWPTDVLAGWALGTSVALIVTVAGVLVGRMQPADPDDRGESPRLAFRSLHRVHQVLVSNRTRSMHGATS